MHVNRCGQDQLPLEWARVFRSCTSCWPCAALYTTYIPTHEMLGGVGPEIGKGVHYGTRPTLCKETVFGPTFPTTVCVWLSGGCCLHGWGLPCIVSVRAMFMGGRCLQLARATMCKDQLCCHGSSVPGAGAGELVGYVSRVCQEPRRDAVLNSSRALQPARLLGRDCPYDKKDRRWNAICVSARCWVRGIMGDGQAVG